MGTKQFPILEPMVDCQADVDSGLIQIEVADGKGARGNGGLAVAYQSRPHGLLESEVGEVDGRNASPQLGALPIDLVGLAGVFQSAEYHGECPKRLALRRATLSFVD